jgi:hypothetical protein
VNHKFDYHKSTEGREAHRQWAKADYMLYDRLNQTFWEKMRQQGPDFHDEVKHFRQITERVQGYCASVDKYKSSQDENPGGLLKNQQIKSLKIGSSPFNDHFRITPTDCEEMLKRPDEFYHQMLRSNYSWLKTLWIYFYHHLLKFL